MTYPLQSCFIFWNFFGQQKQTTTRAIIMARAITPPTIPTIIGSISGPSSESREGKLIFSVRIRAIKAGLIQSL